MSKQSSKREMWIMGAIIAIAFLLRFWKLWELDVQHDVALNAMRALGWFDFLTGKEQTAPIVWFNHTPWWANLSFHDHPPLVFAIHWLSLFIFGQGSFGVFAPFALAGVAAVGLVFVLLHRVKGIEAAVIGSAMLAVSSYGVWAARTGYLEGIELLWILASFGALVWFLQTEKPRWLYCWALFTALALLSKYTAIFILPAALGFFLWRKRAVFKSRHLWLSLGLILLSLAPVIFYNVMVFRSRGHFDAAFSSIVGLHPEDFESISERGISFDLLGNANALLQSLGTTSAITTALVWLTCLALGAWAVARKRARDEQVLLLLYQVFGLALLFMLGTGARFSLILLPLMALQIAYVAADWFTHRPVPKYRFAFAALLLGFELAFAINTNLTVLPVGAAPWAYAPPRFYANGFSSLDTLLRDNFVHIEGAPRRPANGEDIYGSYALAGRPMVVFDQRADWFSRVWYVDRYVHYYNAPIVYFIDFFRTLEQSQLQFVDFLQATKATKFVFVIAQPAGRVWEPNETYDRLAEGLEQSLKDKGVTPFETIRNAKGEEVLTVYAFSL